MIALTKARRLFCEAKKAEAKAKAAAHVINYLSSLEPLN
jgi:hypothetical protein